MVQIYKTSDMELAIREMSFRNDKYVVYRKNMNRRKIPLRLNQVKDLPFQIARVWDERFNDALEFWEGDGGMLLYTYDIRRPHYVNAEAALFVEAPLRMMEFQDFTNTIEREVVVYRPPTWHLHEDTLEYTTPSSSYYHTLITLVHCLMGRDLSERMEAAFVSSGYKDRFKTAVFEASEIQAITGIDERQMRLMLSGYGWRKSYVRYHCYTPMVEPEDSEMLYIYNLLCEVPDVWRGQRMLKFDYLPQGRVMGFHKYMKRLIKEGYVQKHPSVYVIKMGYRPLDYSMIDAVVNAKRGEWFKMRNIIDSAPEYPIVLCLDHETQSEPSESEPT